MTPYRDQIHNSGIISTVLWPTKLKNWCRNVSIFPSTPQSQRPVHNTEDQVLILGSCNRFLSLFQWQKIRAGTAVFLAANLPQHLWVPSSPPICITTQAHFNENDVSLSAKSHWKLRARTQNITTELIPLRESNDLSNSEPGNRKQSLWRSREKLITNQAWKWESSQPPTNEGVKYCDHASKGFLEMYKWPGGKETRSFLVAGRKTQNTTSSPHVGWGALTPPRCCPSQHSLQQKQVPKTIPKPKPHGLALTS